MIPNELIEKFNVASWGYVDDPIPLSFDHYENWIKEGREGELKYLSDYRFDKRKSLKEVYPEFQSALVFLFDYSKERKKLQNFYHSSDSNGLKIASYVLGFKGQDYHEVVRGYLKEIGEELQKQRENLEFSYSLDIQPVLERDLAYKAGLGWFGKNSMLINRTSGSFFIIGSLLLNQKLNLHNNHIETDHCGQCTRCIDACPTLAIDSEKRTIIADKCISTYTIELFKDEKDPPEGMDKGAGEIFGCDICQDVCPWNERPLRLNDIRETYDFSQNKTTQKIYDFFLSKNPVEVINSLKDFSKRSFKKEFMKTPIERTGKEGIIKNLKFWKDRLK